MQMSNGSLTSTPKPPTRSELKFVVVAERFGALLPERLKAQWVLEHERHIRDVAKTRLRRYNTD